MATLTSKLSLRKPTPNSERDWGYRLNESMDILDDALLTTSVSGVGEVYVYDEGDGSVTISGITEQYLHMRDEKTQGTDGGNFNSGSWIDRDLNTEATNTIEGASLNTGTGVFTLPSGTYRISAAAPAYSVANHKAALFNTSDSTFDILGTSEYSASATASTDSVVKGQFAISSSKNFKIQHRCTSSQAGNGFGVAASLGTEVYTEVEIWKVL